MAAERYIHTIDTVYGACNLRTVSVREVAEALGVNKRTILYRLENKKLHGNRVLNENGVQEWRIFPTKEIIDAINDPARKKAATVEAEEIVEEFFGAEPEQVQGEVLADVVEDVSFNKMRQFAEEFVRPLVEQLQTQSKELARKELEVEHLKIKLLPDLEKQAEKEREAAILKEHEINSLKQQIEAMKVVTDKELSEALEHVATLQMQLTGLPKKDSWFKRFFMPREEN